MLSIGYIVEPDDNLKLNVQKSSKISNKKM